MGSTTQTPDLGVTMELLLNTSIGYRTFRNHSTTSNPVLASLSPDNSFQESLLSATTVMTNVTEIVDNMTTFPEMEPIPEASSVILVILYTLTTLAAVVGNSLAIVVFARGKRSNTDLRLFLINLAVADLIMAIFCIPFTFAYQITGRWMFSDVMCPIVQCCQIVSVTASVSTNTAIGIDRFVAVKFPLRKRVTTSRTKLVIFFIWLFAWSVGIIPLITGRTMMKGGNLKCEEVWPDDRSRLAYSFFIIIITYFLPVTILSVTYTMIGRQLWRHILPGNADDHRDAVQLKSKRKVVKMLVTIVLLFGVCWLPLHLFIITITFNAAAFGAAANEVYFGVHWLSMANSFVNPVVYGFMNDNFRADLATMCTCCCPWRHKRCKYRPGASRWKFGDANVHDASNLPQGFKTKTLNRFELDMKKSAAHPRQKYWRNGHSNSSPAIDLSSLQTIDSVTSEDVQNRNHKDHCSGNNAGRSIFIEGKHRHYEPCTTDPPGLRSVEGNGVTVSGDINEVGRGNNRTDCGQEGRARVFYDGSDAVLLADHHTNLPG